MLKTLHLKNFRGFQDLKLGPLSRVNLITGKNDVGKTSLLEAIFLLFVAEPNTSFGEFASTFRNSQQNSRDDFISFWEWLFFEKNTKLKPSIIGEMTEGSGYFCNFTFSLKNEVEINFGRDQHHENKINVGSTGYGGKKVDRPAVLVESTRLGKPIDDAELYNRVSLMAGGEEKIVELMRVVEPRLKKLRYSKITSQPLVYADIGLSHFVPSTQMGQGFNRLLSLFCEMLVSKAKILLIDEVENGLHHSTLSKVWKGLGALAESENIQIFATTHSTECLFAAHKSFQSLPKYDLSVTQLFRDKEGIKGRVIDKEHIEVAEEADIDIR